MAILEGKKAIIIGDRDGIPGPAIAECVLTAGALEYKDKAYGGNWDWIDFGLTVAGTCVGQLVRTIV